MTTLNEHRVTSTESYIKQLGFKDGLDWFTALSDMLADLRHVADNRGFDFDAAVEDSEPKFQDAIKEDNYPIDIIRLTTCEFCGKGTGAIMIDVPALAKVRKSHEEGDWQEMIDHAQVLKFNSPQFGAGPCPHLVYLMADFWWGAKIVRGSGGAKVDPIDWSTGFQWTNPVLRELDVDDIVKGLWHVSANSTEYQALLQDRDHQVEKFEKKLTDLDSTHQDERLYETQGIAVFSADIPALIADMIEFEK